MSTHTWSQYVAMEDTNPEPGRLNAALECLADWDDDFELDGPGHEVPGAQIEDPE